MVAALIIIIINVGIFYSLQKASALPFNFMYSHFVINTFLENTTCAYTHYLFHKKGIGNAKFGSCRFSSVSYYDSDLVYRTIGVRGKNHELCIQRKRFIISKQVVTSIVP